MVVVLIIGILIAIALPTFLGARTRAQNRAAQSDLRNALVAAKTIYTDDSAYTVPPVAAVVGAVHAEPANVEPSLTYVAGAATVSTIVSVTGHRDRLGGRAQSASGTCYYISDDAAVGTTYGQAAVGNCAGPVVAGLATATSWT